MRISTLVNRALKKIDLMHLLIIIFIYGALFISEYSSWAWVVFIVYFIILILLVSPKSIELG